MHVLIQIACCIWNSSAGGADHWEGWKQGRGEPIERCSVQATPQVGAWDTVPLGMLQGATENTESSRRDRRAVCSYSLPSQALIRGYPRSRVLFTWWPRCELCCSGWTFYATVAEKIPGLKGRGLFPEEACYSPSSAGGCSSEQSIKWAERRAEAREALDTVKWFVGKVALQKHRGNSVLFDYSVRKTA